MWCASCQADVAAQVAKESGRVHCAQCNMELAQAHAIRERTKDAREILERWSTKSMNDPYGPLPGTGPGKSRQQASEERRANEEMAAKLLGDSLGTPAAQLGGPTVPAHADQAPAATPGSGAKRTFRIDRPTNVNQVAETNSPRLRSQRKAVQRHVDPAHGNRLRGPHFQMAPPKQPSWAVATGQWLAYLGVLGLTIGTAIVVYGHFGGYANYTPTGWLITTVGQMLLFLGVINLVSGGMEQSNDEVSQRIDVIGERLMRIEAATDEALRGPKIPAHRYAEGETEQTESTRQDASMK